MGRLGGSTAQSMVGLLIDRPEMKGGMAHGHHRCPRWSSLNFWDWP